ncbi:MAG: GbsR/MarR family transcriptional regulator [Bacteroidia bacterium]
MDFAEAKVQFISTWGNYGQQWGINKAMGQIHALLLVSQKSLCRSEVMELLQISSGNANTNLRALANMGLLIKLHIPGDRNVFYKAEKDITVIAKILSRERKRRGIDPVIKSLIQIKDPKGKPSQIKEFRKVIKDISGFAVKADKYMERLLESL